MSQFVVRAKGGLRLHEYCRYKSPTIKGLTDGTQVQDFGITVTADDYVWRFILVDGVYGWAADQYLAPVVPSFPVPTPVPVPPSPVATGGYGRHYLGNQNDTDLAGDHYPIAKAVDQPDVLVKLHARNPNALYIFRHYLSTDEQNNRLRLMQTDMQGALNQWFGEMQPFFQKVPFAYFESLNEVDAPSEYVEFEQKRTARLAAMGMKACVLNLSVGRSDAAMWARCKALVDTVNLYGGIVGEHSYAMSVMSNNAGSSYVDSSGNWHGDVFPVSVDPAQCWTALRIIQSRVSLTFQGQGQTRLVATELGLGKTLGPGLYGLFNVITEGWRDCIPLWQKMGWLNGTTAEAFYVKQLRWWAATTGCLGVAYTFGTGGDAQWNVDSVQGVI